MKHFIVIGCISVLSANGASFRGLGDLPGGPFLSVASGLSVDGRVVVGTSQSSNGYEAFRWTAATGMIGLGDFAGGSFSSAASGVSADGTVIAGYGTGASGPEAFRWTITTGMVGLGDLPGGFFASYGFAISADGNVIVGQSSSALAPAYSEAFRWTPASGMVGLGELPGGRTNSQAFAVNSDGSVVVGASGSAAGTTWEAFRWSITNGMVALGDFPGAAFNSVAYGISPDGSTIVGRGYTGVEDPFRWTQQDGMTHLGFLPCDTWSTAFAASANGSVIVGDPNQSAGNCAFIWDAQHGIRNLHSMLTNDYGLNFTGWELTRARAITPDGKIIVGDGKNPAGQKEAWIVDLTPPSLAISHGSGHIVLSWNTNAPGFFLQQATPVIASNAWTNVSTSPAVMSNRYVMTNNIDPDKSFYRLAKP